jgi:hypothetical protein
MATEAAKRAATAMFFSESDIERASEIIDSKFQDVIESLQWICEPMTGDRVPHDGGDVWIVVRNRPGASQWFDKMKIALADIDGGQDGHKDR